MACRRSRLIERFLKTSVFILSDSLLASDAQADTVISALIDASPGFAISLLTDSARLWFAPGSGEIGEILVIGERLRAASQRWFDVFRQIAELGPIVQDGVLPALGVRSYGPGNLEYAWLSRRDLGDVFELPPNFSILQPDEFLAASMNNDLRQRRTWTWSHTLKDFIQPLIRGLAERDYPWLGGDDDEMAWQAALRFCGLGSLHPDPVPLELILRHPGVEDSDFILGFGNRRPYPTLPLREKARTLLAAGETMLTPPWPTGLRGGRWVWSGYTNDQFRERTRIVFRKALRVYLQLVRRWAPRLEPRLPLAALMPLTFHVEITQYGREQAHGNPQAVTYTTPRPAGSENEVLVTEGEPRPIDHYRRILEEAWRQAPDRAWIRGAALGGRSSNSGTGSSHGLLDVTGAEPATEFAYVTLHSELKALLSS